MIHALTDREEQESYYCYGSDNYRLTYGKGGHSGNPYPQLTLLAQNTTA